MISQDEPLSQEVEQAFLGILLAFPEKIDSVYGLISPEHFKHPAHEEIFKTIMAAHAEGELVSPILIGKKLPHIDGLPKHYIPDLASSVFTAVNLNGYIQAITSSHEKKLFLEKLDEIKTQALGANNVANLKTELFSFLENRSEKSIFSKDKKQAMNEVLTALEKPKPCFPTGIGMIDQCMGGGLFEGFTYGFAGAEKSGKTTTAQTISYNLNMAGVKHAYLALEMGSNQIEQRNIARYIGVNSLRFLEKPSPEFLTKVANAIATMPNNTIYSDMAGASFDQIKAELHKLVRIEKVSGFILDYWQLVGGMDNKTNRSDFLFDIAQWCAAFARRNKVFCIILSQLNRKGELLGSAGIERACDQLYIIEAPENYIYKAVNMRLTHSRYTHTASLGSDDSPAFEINQRAGPYLMQI